MASPRDALLTALEAWRQEAARERVGRWRGDADASPSEVVAQRHAALSGPRTRDHFEEARERGALSGSELATAAHWLREAIAASTRARHWGELAATKQERVPYDSDHFPAGVLLMRAIAHPKAKTRGAMAKALEPYFDRRFATLRRGRAQLEEAAERAEWLAETDFPLPDETPDTNADTAAKILDATSDAWRELTERIAHAARSPIETWSDLGFVLRAHRFDSAVKPRDRWRRIAQKLAPLGLDRALSKRVRTVGSSGSSLEAGVAAISVPEDIRVRGGREIGVQSERNASVALGRGLAMALTQPAESPLVGRVASGTVGRLLGRLLAHLYTDARFVERTLGLKPARPFVELVVALELFEQRTWAAQLVARAHIDSHDFRDAAHDSIRSAWEVDVPSGLAACVCSSNAPYPAARFRSARWTAPLFIGLRERFDEDFWRNPRLADVIRGACARGPRLSAEAWMEELSIASSSPAARLAELLD